MAKTFKGSQSGHSQKSSKKTYHEKQRHKASHKIFHDSDEYDSQSQSQKSTRVNELDMGETQQISKRYFKPRVSIMKNTRNSDSEDTEDPVSRDNQNTISKENLKFNNPKYQQDFENDDASSDW